MPTVDSILIDTYYNFQPHNQAEDQTGYSVFQSCLMNKNEESSISQEKRLLRIIDKNIEDNIGFYLDECNKLVSKSEAPFMPSTFTLWR